MSAYGPAQKRSNYFKTLACAWLVEKRPDVVRVIWEEVDKKFPNRGRLRITLPKSLKGTK